MNCSTFIASGLINHILCVKYLLLLSTKDRQSNLIYIHQAHLYPLQREKKLERQLSFASHGLHFLHQHLIIFSLKKKKTLAHTKPTITRKAQTYFTPLSPLLKPQSWKKLHISTTSPKLLPFQNHNILLLPHTHREQNHQETAQTCYYRLIYN